mmetsp:Transcript_4146/g.14483  ORF Transcript_4146/g.14483 Transcript_4146/m.14483 type:complete len:383 (-) Transcript_4146:150-1298(-)
MPASEFEGALSPAHTRTESFRASPAPAETRLSDLPSSILIEIALSLSVEDSLALSATCNDVRGAISGAWQARARRLPWAKDAALLPRSGAPASEWASAYRELAACSRFPAVAPTGGLQLYYGSRAELFGASKALRAEVWFRTAERLAGILLGCQSLPLNNPVFRWPHYHWQILFVDMRGRIRGAFESEAHSHIVGPFVADGSWHHAVVEASFHGDEHARQRLWVDGVLCGTLEGRGVGIGGENAFHEHIQVGSGVISGDTQGKPRHDFNGRLPFQGEMRSVRFARVDEEGERTVAAWVLDPRRSQEPHGWEWRIREAKSSQRDFLPPSTIHTFRSWADDHLSVRNDMATAKPRTKPNSATGSSNKPESPKSTLDLSSLELIL